MKTRTELGAIAGKLIVRLYREDNNKAQATLIKRWGHLLCRYATGNVLGGLYPMQKVVETMLQSAKTKQTKDNIKSFAKDIAEAGLSEVSFYQCGGGLVGIPSDWVGGEFQIAFTESLAVNMAKWK